MTRFNKLIFFFSFLLFFQNAQADKSNLNIIGAYNTSNLQIEYTGNTNTFFGTESQTVSDVGFGILFEIPIANKWNFESGIIYSPRGYKSNSSNYTSAGLVTGLDTSKWMNFYVPIEGRFHPTRVFTGFIGVYVAQAIDKITFTSFTTPNSPITRSFKDSGLKSFDNGLTYGIGMNFDVSTNTEMLLEIRWNEGLANLADTSQTNIGSNTKVTMHDYSFIIGFKL